MEWITELFEKIVPALAMKIVGKLLVEALARLARLLPQAKDCYYPGSRLMSIVCWLKHPISDARRAEAEFSAGWNWPDPDEITVRVG